MNEQSREPNGKKMKIEVKCRYLSIYNEDDDIVELFVFGDGKARVLCSYYRKGGYCAIENRTSEVDDDDLWHECGIMSAFLEDEDSAESE